MSKISNVTLTALAVGALTVSSVGPAFADDAVTPQVNSSVIEETNAPAELEAPVEEPVETPEEIVVPEETSTEEPAPVEEELVADDAPEIVEEDNEDPSDEAGDTEGVNYAPTISVISTTETEASLALDYEYEGANFVEVTSASGATVFSGTVMQGEIFTLDNLVSGETYTVNARVVNLNGDTYSATQSFKTKTALPTAPELIDGSINGGSTSVTGTGLKITFEAGEGGGAVDSYIIVARNVATNHNYSVTTTTPGTHNIAVPAGDYSVSVTASNDSGSASTSNYYFNVPSAPVAPNVEISGDLGSRVVGLKISSPTPNYGVPNPGVSPVTHTVTVTGDNYSETQTAFGVTGYSNFTGLKPSTAYTVTVTTENVAGVSTATMFFFTTRTDVPNASTLNPSNKGGIGVPAIAKPNAPIVIQLNPARAGETVNGWLFSDPTFLGTSVVGADGKVSFNIPAGISLSQHRLIVTDSLDELIGWDNVKVTNGSNGGGNTGGGGSDNGGNTGGGDDDSNGGGKIGTGVSGSNGGNDSSITGSKNDATSAELAHTGSTSFWSFSALGALLVAAGGALMVKRRKA